MRRTSLHRSFCRRISAASLGLILTVAMVAGVELRSAGSALASDAPPAAPATVSLASSATTFLAGGSVTLTAATDVDVAPSASVLSIVDQTAGQTVASCSSGTTCSAVVAFYTGPPHNYVATVNALTSSVVAVSRQAWTVSLSEDKTVFAAGDQVQLTATANQLTSRTLSSYAIYIFDKTRGQQVGSCGPQTSAPFYQESAGQSICTVPTRFYTGGPHTYTAVVAAWNSNPAPATVSDATDVQATSNDVTAARQAWTVSLSEDKTVFAAGDQVQLTATANQLTSRTLSSYAIYIFDKTSGQQVGSCGPQTSAPFYQESAGQSICTVPTRFYTGGPHTYTAVVAAWNSNPAPATVSDATDVQASSDPVSASRVGWSVVITTDKTTYAAGDQVQLTATANQLLSGTQSSYAIFIFDKTTGQEVGACWPPRATAPTYQESAGQSICTVPTRFYTGGPHTYTAAVAAWNYNTSPATVSDATDVQATSNDVTAARQAWTVSLSEDKTVFAAGDQVQLTATANQLLSGTQSSYAIFIFDKTTGQEVGACWPPRATAPTYQESAGQSICTVPTRFYTGGPHTYTAAVAAWNYNTSPATVSDATDVQATSNDVTAARQAWTVSLSEDKTVFAAGDQVQLTATANQLLSGTQSSYAIFIFDKTTGQEVGACWPPRATAPTYQESAGQSICTVPTRFYTGGPHTYTAVVAAWNYNTSPATVSDATDVQATSNDVTAARQAWTVSLSEDKTVFAAGDQVQLTATANQLTSRTLSSYAIYIFDKTSGQQVGSCGPQTSAPFYQESAGQSICTVPTRFYTGGPHTYTAVVAAWNSNPAPATVSDATDAQATSNDVTAARQAWTAGLTASVSVTSDNVVATLTASANQDVGRTVGSYEFLFVDYVSGSVLGTCSSGQSCAITVSTPKASTTPHMYLAFVAAASGSNPAWTDVQAVSNGFSADTGSGAILPGESSAGSNPSEKACQCSHKDPVNTATGEFYLPATDLTVGGVGPAVTLGRTYSSGSASVDGPLGFGWSMNYGARVVVLTPGNVSDPLPRVVQVVQDNGSTVTFTEDANGNYLAAARVLATLSV